MPISSPTLLGKMVSRIPQYSSSKDEMATHPPQPQDRGHSHCQRRQGLRLPLAHSQSSKNVPRKRWIGQSCLNSTCPRTSSETTSDKAVSTLQGRPSSSLQHSGFPWEYVQTRASFNWTRSSLLQRESARRLSPPKEEHLSWAHQELS